VFKCLCVLSVSFSFSREIESISASKRVKMELSCERSSPTGIICNPASAL